jgi:DNA relaxase NicK
VAEKAGRTYKVITNASVDWVTMTTTNDGIGAAWYTMYAKYRKMRQKEADRETPFSNGYYSGFRIGSMQWGYQEHLGYICIISGEDAERYWYTLSPTDARVTRLDLCCDFMYQDLKYLALELFEKASDQRKQEKPGLSLFIGPEGGDTLYVGSRHSQQFGRLYDKGVESGTSPPGHYWRAEVEFKKPLSGLMAAELVQETGENRVQAIADTVVNWFFDRDIKVLEDTVEGRRIQISVEQRITTAEKKLAWLRTQVQPTVRQLVSLGLGKEVAKSLLLNEDMLLRMFATEN